MTAETWTNLTGNPNAPDLLLSANGSGAKPSFDIHAVTLDGDDDYMVTDGNLSLSSYDQITVEVVIRPNHEPGAMLETSSNFNRNDGAFVVDANHTGYIPLDGASYLGYHYTGIPQLPGNLEHLPTNYHGQDYLFNNSDDTLQTHSMIFSAIVDSTGFRKYFNGELLQPYPVPAQATTTLDPQDWTLEEANFNAPFGNYPLYIGARAGNETFWQSDIASLRIYSRKLTATEIGDNHQLDLKRFIAPPKVWIGSQQCENVTVLSPRALTCKVPAMGNDQIAGVPLEIVVTSADDDAILSHGGFEYIEQ
jgi:hypothetical protein